MFSERRLLEVSWYVSLAIQSKIKHVNVLTFNYHKGQEIIGFTRDIDETDARHSLPFDSQDNVRLSSTHT